MKEENLTALEREVFEEMARRNGAAPEMIYKTCIHSDTRYVFHYFADKFRPPLTDISPLAKLAGLETITLYQCEVRDISPLARISTLQEITISGGPDILPCDLTPLRELWFLCLRTRSVSSIPKLSGLPKLRCVILSQIDSLEGLRGLRSLERLEIGDNPALNSLSPLASCPCLEELNASRTAVRDLTPLAGHPGLKWILLSNTPVTDASPLAAVPTLETIGLSGTAVEDVSSLAALPKLNVLNLRGTKVVDLSAFQGRESILNIERKKLGIKKAGKSAAEMKTAVDEIKERLDKLGIVPQPPLKREDIADFQEKSGAKLPKEYAAFLTKIGDGFEVSAGDFRYRLPPLGEVRYDPSGVKKRFAHREGWCWEDDDSADDRKIGAAVENGQIELMDCGCGRSFRLIVCGGAKGEVWEMTDVGIAPYGNGMDFLDWLKDFLDGKNDFQ